MRFVLVAAPLLCVLFAGCTYYVQTPPEGAYSSARDSHTCTDSDGEGSDVATTSDDTSPPTAHAPRDEGTFELVARAVLRSVPYKDCGAGGRGDVDVTFMPNGIVQKVVVWADGWQDTAKECVSERFALAHVLPFAGDARTVRWHVRLEENGWGT